MYKLIPKLEYKDLSEDMKILADIIGLDLTKKVMSKLAGQRLKIPRKLEKNFMLKYIVSNWTGNNGPSIYKKLGISSTTFFEYLSQKRRLSSL